MSEENIVDRLGWEVRNARTKHKIRVEAAAEQIGISASTLRRIENGTSRNCQGMTLMQILYWAHTKLGYTEFCGFNIRDGVISDATKRVN